MLSKSIQDLNLDQNYSRFFLIYSGHMQAQALTQMQGQGKCSYSYVTLCILFFRTALPARGVQRVVKTRLNLYNIIIMELLTERKKYQCQHYNLSEHLQ